MEFCNGQPDLSGTVQSVGEALKLSYFVIVADLSAHYFVGLELLVMLVSKG